MLFLFMEWKKNIAMLEKQKKPFVSKSQFYFQWLRNKMMTLTIITELFLYTLHIFVYLTHFCIPYTFLYTLHIIVYLTHFCIPYTFLYTCIPYTFLQWKFWKSLSSEVLVTMVLYVYFQVQNNQVLWRSPGLLVCWLELLVEHSG